MNVFILTDIEGVDTVLSMDYVRSSKEEYQIACRGLEKSINLATEACLKAGAETVYYLDAHGGGGNVAEENIDSRAIKCTLDQWEELLQAGKIDCQIELGAHARAGTIDGFLDHTVSSSEFFTYKVNGVEMSELSLHALVCAAYGVPVVACTGDETVCNQSREYIPEIYTAAVKKASGRNSATRYENADTILSQTIFEAVKNYKNVPCYPITGPAAVELTFYRTDMCENVYAICKDFATRVDARTLYREVPAVTSYADLRFW